MDFLNIKIDKVSNAFELQRMKEDTRKTLNRNTSGIVIIKNGKLSYYQDGEEFVQTADTAIILPKGITYSIYCHEDAFCYLVNFTEETNLMGKRIQTVKVAHKNNIIDKMDKMCRCYSMRSNSYKLMLMSLMYGILAELNTSLTMDKQQKKYYEIIKPSVDYMEEHYCDSDMKNDDLARLSNVSTVYFRKIFTKLYGVAPMHYLEIRKIEKAKELLAYYELSVTDVAMASGFKDIYHFCRAFKKITGFSPSDYRKEVMP